MKYELGLYLSIALNIANPTHMANMHNSNPVTCFTKLNSYYQITV